jgi:hypothetical protein
VTDEEQEARSNKFEPRGSVTLRQLSTGNFALYPLGGIGSPFWIGPLEQLGEAYAKRPEPTLHAMPPRPKAKAKVGGIDLAGLDFNL